MPIADLPERIELSLPHAAAVFQAVALGREVVDPASPAGRALAEANRILLRALWPELGDLMEEGDCG